MICSPGCTVHVVQQALGMFAVQVKPQGHHMSGYAHLAMSIGQLTLAAGLSVCQCACCNNLLKLQTHDFPVTTQTTISISYICSSQHVCTNSNAACTDVSAPAVTLTKT